MKINKEILTAIALGKDLAFDKDGNLAEASLKQQMYNVFTKEVNSDRAIWQAFNEIESLTCNVYDTEIKNQALKRLGCAQLCLKGLEKKVLQTNNQKLIRELTSIQKTVRSCIKDIA
jgi:hypothetical protein